jgi:hypothetical protein
VQDANLDAEVDFLKAAKNLPRVGQYEEGVYISDLRMSSELRSLVSVIVLGVGFPLNYMTPIDELNSREEFLVALRDGEILLCISSTSLATVQSCRGHLWNTSVLRRDVSIHNILFGTPGAQEGDRGFERWRNRAFSRS